MMNRICLRALAPLVLVFGLGTTPALAQSDTDPASEVNGFACVIDLSELNSGLDPVTTFDTRKLCTGSLTRENIKLECFDQIDPPPSPESTKEFVCLINGVHCNVVAPADDPNKPLLTATSQIMKIGESGAVQMICFFQPK